MAALGRPKGRLLYTGPIPANPSWWQRWLLGRVDGVSGAMQAAADGIGQGHRALVRQPGERLGWIHRLEVMRGGRGWQGADLDGQHAIRAASAADLEEVLEVLDRL